jgi:hypothetical protein
MKLSRGTRTYFSVGTLASTFTDKKIFPSNIIASSIQLPFKNMSWEDTESYRLSIDIMWTVDICINKTKDGTYKISPLKCQQTENI